MDLLLLVVVLALAAWTWLVFLKPVGRLPPGPYPLPVIGNLLQLGQLPHRSLAKLSQTYGPLMSLHLGRIYTVVVSSSDVAQQILTKHDLAFSSRNIIAAARVQDHHKVGMVFLPVGPLWRKLRKVSKEQLFTTSRLDAGEGLRQEIYQKLRDYTQKCCDSGQAMNITAAAFSTTLNLVSSVLFSVELVEFESNTIQEFKSIADGMLGVLGQPNLADYFPVLQRFDPQGIRNKSEVLFHKMITFIEDLIHQRLASPPDSPKKNDFMETLLHLSQGSDENMNFSVNDIAHILLEFIIGGVDTTTVTTEWAMTRLLLNPDKFFKVKQELNTVIGQNHTIQESDFSQLPYFQAMIKEVFRCHSPGPLLIPHMSEQDVEINGYTIPKGTQLLINAHAIGRDPSRWSNPESFEPERFLDKKIDYKGHDFDLLPFGAGRRMCPGLSLGDRMVHMMVATFVHNFDWILESNSTEEETMAETFGLAVHKTVPLVATPIKLQS